MPSLVRGSRGRHTRIVGGLTVLLYASGVANLVLWVKQRESHQGEQRFRRQAIGLMGDAIIRDADQAAWFAGQVDPLGHAWAMRTDAGATESVGAFWNLLDLAVRDDDERGSQYWDEVGRAIEAIDLSDPMRTPTDQSGYRLMSIDNPAYPAWVVGDRLCELRIRWSEARGEAGEVDRLWLRRRDIVLSPGPAGEVHTAADQYASMAGYIEHCKAQGKPGLILEIESELLAIATAATSMSTGGEWRTPHVSANVALARWELGDRESAESWLRQEADSPKYSVDNGNEYGRLASLRALSMILRRTGRGDEAAEVDLRIEVIEHTGGASIDQSPVGE